MGTASKKLTVLDELKKEKILTDLSFWKFYLLWTIRHSVGSCKVNEER